MEMMKITLSFVVQMMQILSDAELDRKVLVSCQIGPALMPFLSEDMEPDV